MCGLTFTWRIHTFKSLEPFTDQIFFIQWIKRLHLADHIFPLNPSGDSWLRALMHDEQSVLNIYLRQVYATHAHVFTVFSVAWFYLWSFVVGTDVDSQVALSIATNALSLFVLALMPFYVFADKGPNRVQTRLYGISLLILLLSILNPFMTYFSAIGPHNFGVLSLLVATVFNARWLASGGFESNRRGSLCMAVVQTIALYSYYTNVFLLPVGTFLAIAFAQNRGWNWKKRNCLLYAALIILTMLPALFLMSIEVLNVVGIQNSETLISTGGAVFYSLERTLSEFDDRFIRWFSFHQSALPAGGLFIAIAGLAAIWKFEKLPLFALLIFAHLGAASILNGFGYYQKTSGYVVPFLILGYSWLVVRAFVTLSQCRFSLHFATVQKLVWAIPVVLIFLAATVGMIPDLRNHPNFPAMSSFVVQGHDKRTVYQEIDSTLSPGDTLVPPVDTIAQEYWSYSHRAGKDIYVFRPFGTLVDKLHAGNLTSYLTARNLSPKGKGNFVFLVVTNQFNSKLVEDLNAVYGENGFNISRQLSFEHLKTWETSQYPSMLTSLSLYRANASDDAHHNP